METGSLSRRFFIERNGKPYTGYFISKDRLLQTGLEQRQAYDWLLHLAHKNWLTETDIYALNTALVYALEYFGKGNRFSKLFFVKSIDKQAAIIRSKNSEPNKGVLPLKCRGIEAA